MMVARQIPLPVFNQSGDPAGSIDAPGAFLVRPNAHILYLAVVKQLANARVGSASTKTKGEVRGGGKKPWKQKHTGRARQGSIRNPHWSGGGVAFGPRPRKYTKEMPTRVRRIALQSALAGKARAGQVAVLETLSLDPPKTKVAAALLKKMSVSGRTLVVLMSRDNPSARAFRNIPDTRVESAATVSVYDLVSARHILVLQDALDVLVKRCVAAGE